MIQCCTVDPDPDLVRIRLFGPDQNQDSESFIMDKLFAV